MHLWEGTQTTLEDQGTTCEKIKRATKPGEAVSIDQLVSTTAGLVPQAKGVLTTRRYTGATIFVDHASDLTYVHLMETLSGDETLKAKQAFEHMLPSRESRSVITTVTMGNLLKRSLWMHVNLPTKASPFVQ